MDCLHNPQFDLVPAVSDKAGHFDGSGAFFVGKLPNDLHVPSGSLRTISDSVAATTVAPTTDSMVIGCSTTSGGVESALATRAKR